MPELRNKFFCKSHLFRDSSRRLKGANKMSLTAKLTEAQFNALKEMMEMVTRDVINRDDYSFFDLLNSEKRARKLLVEKDTNQ
jgi:hypothetical protein